jgi:L-threonylcarbamoyladenylate synthase
VDSKYIEILKNGGIGVIPTDTIYGLVGSAFCKPAVTKIEELKKRSAGKGFIILISSIDNITKFGVNVSDKTQSLMKRFWPGKLSVAVLSNDSMFNYLMVPDNTITFRLPDNEMLLNFLHKVGPVIAPSANPEGQVPANNIIEARKYFGDAVDFYIDGGEISGQPSTLVKIIGDKLSVLREGAIKSNDIIKAWNEII